MPDCFTLFVIVCCVGLFFGVITTGGFRWLNPFESEWGERFGHWLSSCWNHLVSDFDHLSAFIAENTVWVFATLTGGCGLLLSAGLLFTALPETVQADIDEDQLAVTGSELDASLPFSPIGDADLPAESIPVEVPRNQLRFNSRPSFPGAESDSIADRGAFSRLDDLDNAILGPAPGIPSARENENNFNPPFNSLSEPLAQPARRFNTPPVLSLRIERLAVSDGEIVEPRMTEFAFNALRDDEWMTRGMLSDFAAQPISFETTIRASDQELVPDDPEGSIQVVPGAGVSEQDLLVRKRFPSDIINGAFRYQISVTNQSVNVIDGVVIRESIPSDWIVRDLEPVGRLESSVATWVVYQLRPGETRVLELDVVPSLAGRATTRTEVSAIAAVSRSIRVGAFGIPHHEPDEVLMPDDEGEPLLPGVELPSFGSSGRGARNPFSDLESTPPPRQDRSPFGLETSTQSDPSLELLVQQPESAPAVGSQFEVRFVVRNTGSQPLPETVLRVMLDAGLDHPTLSRDDYLPQDRWVQQPVKMLQPGESRELPLRITANREGEHFCTVEIRQGQVQLELTSFVVKSRLRSGTSRRPMSRP